MSYRFRPVDRSSSAEMRFVAERDSEIPVMYDSNFVSDEDAIQGRLRYYEKDMKEDDFFEVAVDASEAIIGFHLVRKVQFTQNKAMGIIVTLWVAPAWRRHGLAMEMKAHAENWARLVGLDHLSTTISLKNESSLALSQKCGFEIDMYRLKKQL